MTGYYMKPKRQISNFEMHRRVNVFKDALSERPELWEAFDTFRSILIERFQKQNALTERETVSEFYADSILAVLVFQKFLRFD